MQDSAFGFMGEDFTQSNAVSQNFRLAMAAGDLTPAPTSLAPTTGSAAWRGIMVGRRAVGGDAGLIQGRVLMTLRPAGSGGLASNIAPLEVVFSGVRNLHNGSDGAINLSSIDGMLDTTTGTYTVAATSPNSALRGAFFGATGRETAGVFEQRDITNPATFVTYTGAFGAINGSR